MQNAASIDRRYDDSDCRRLRAFLKVDVVIAECCEH